MNKGFSGKHHSEESKQKIKMALKGKLQVYKSKLCVKCGEEFLPTGRRQKYCKECGIIADKKRRKQSLKQYRLENSKQIKKQRKQYNSEHSEQEKQYSRQWRLDNPEKVKKIDTKHKAKRRGLGYIELNPKFIDCVGHHTDKNRVINIPEWMHKSIWHNQSTGQGMKEINELAWDFLISQRPIGLMEATCES